MVSEQLGHCNITITGGIYSHIFEEYTAKVAQAIEYISILSTTTVLFIAILISIQYNYTKYVKGEAANETV